MLVYNEDEYFWKKNFECPTGKQFSNGALNSDLVFINVQLHNSM